MSCARTQLSWATLQSAQTEKGLNSAGSPGETGQRLSVQLLSSSSPKMHGPEGGME